MKFSHAQKNLHPRSDISSTTNADNKSDDSTRTGVSGLRTAHANEKRRGVHRGYECGNPSELKATEAFFPESLPADWRERLASEAKQAYFKELTRFLAGEYQGKQSIFPPRQWVLRAFQLLDFDQVKVVILGQDPYHGDGQANGLSFAVSNDLFPKPPSLVNIFKELESDLKISIARDRSELIGWAEQGVLLLNTVLTVRSGQAFSHRNKGWERFTDQVIRELNEREAPVIFILWGAAAQKKKALISNAAHFVLESPHPSPLSAHRGFFGSRPFSKINDILISRLHESPIDWARI